MNVKINVTEDPKNGPGYALMNIAGLGEIDGDSIAMVIKRTEPNDPVLGPNGWQSSNHLHHLPIVSKTPDVLSVLVDPGHTKMISPHMGLVIEITQPVSASGQTIWPPITQQTGRRSGRFRGIGAESEDETVVARPVQDSVPSAEPSEAIDDSAAMSTEGAPSGSVSPSSSRGLPKPLIYAAIGGVLLAAGGYFAYFSGMFDTAPWGAGEVRSHLQNKPDASTSLEQAKLQIESGQLGLGFLLMKQAASGRVAEAQRILGSMYDPRLFSAETSPLPSANGRIAAKHYQMAADQGDVVAQRNLGILMVEGEHGANPDVPGGTALLEQAASEGDDEAKSYLEILK